MCVGNIDLLAESRGKRHAFFYSCILILLLSTGCAERPPSAFNEDNIPPVVTIVSPANSLLENVSEVIREKGGSLLFEGYAIDAEDDTLEESSLRWTSNIDGKIGSGYSFSRDNLSVGKHEIVLTAIDSEGTAGRDTVEITIADKIEGAPIVKILSIAGFESLTNGLGLSLDADIMLEGTAEDPEDGFLEGESLVWSSDIEGQLGTGTTVDATGRLSVGTHTITLTATDSDGTTGTASAEITIQEEIINNPPIAKILSVAGNTSLDGVLNLLYDEQLILEGTAEDFEDDLLEGESLVWNSDIDGELGTGSVLDVTGILSVGDHTITLTATDSESATDSDEVFISIVESSEEIINGLPVAEILSIAGIESLTDGLSLSFDSEIVLQGYAEDPEDGVLEGESLVWSSDIDGELGTGSVLDVTEQLSLGEHVITLTATDSDGGMDSTSVDLTLKEVVNEIPNVLITSLENGLEFLLGENILLEAEVSDPEDGVLDGDALEWTSSIDGLVGTGNKLNATDLLSIGDHTITLTATDSEGATAEDQVSISILDPLPAAPTGLVFEILSPYGIQLDWVDNSDNETGFLIEQTLNGELLGTISTGSNTTSYSFSDLGQGTYSFRVAAENDQGSSEFSEPVQLTIPLQITNVVSQDYTINSTVDSTSDITIGYLDDLLSESFAALRFDNISKEIEGRNIKKAVLYLDLTANSSFETIKTFSTDAFITIWNDPVVLTDSYELAGLEVTDEMASSTEEQQAAFDVTPIIKQWASGELDNNGLIVQMEENITDILSLVYFESLETNRQLAPRIVVDFAD